MHPKRTSRLFMRLYGGFLAVALTGLVFAEVLVDRTVQTMARAQVEERLSYIATMLGQMCAGALFGPVDSTDASLSREISELGQAVHTQLFLMTTDGQVVVDSDASEAPKGQPPASDPEIDAARRAAVGIAIRGQGPQRKIYVARPIERDGKLLGFARAAFPMDVVDESIIDVRLRFAIGAAAAVLIALVLGFLISLRIVRPVKALAEGARRIGAGEYDQHISITTKDELADLARAFNEMAKDLGAAMENLRRRNQDLRLVFDNVKQGFITAVLGGALSSERSAILDRWFGTPSETGLVWDYLGAHDHEFCSWMRLSWDALSEDVLPLEVAIDQLPKRIERRPRTFEVAYIPIRIEDEVAAVLIVVTDITTELERARAAEEQLENLAIFKSITIDRTGFAEFMIEAEMLVKDVLRPGRSEAELRRSLHTLKGACAAMGVSTMASFCHSLEADLDDGRPEDLRERLPELEQQWQKVVATAEQLGVTGRARHVEIPESDFVSLAESIRAGIEQDRLVSMLESWKLEPAELRLSRFANQARALSHRLGKQLEVHIVAHGVRLDAETWRGFWSAFTHAVRNAVDHGIEAPEERRAGGKAETARIDLLTKLDETGLLIEIRDDGRGIAWDAIRERGRRAGLPAQTREDLARCLFHLGLTTKDDVTEDSGRGIGLAVVKRATDEIGGEVRVESVEGKGTCLQFRFSVEAVTKLGPNRVSSTQLKASSPVAPNQGGQNVA